MDSSNITSIISNSINYMFNNIISSIDNSLYLALDDFTFINSNILNDEYFYNILGTNSSNGILLVANALIAGYLIYYSIKLVLSRLELTQIEKPFQFIFKLLLCAICMNFSFFICDELIYFISLISSSIRYIGENLFNTQICFSNLISRLNNVISSSDNLNIFSIDGIIKSLISLGLLNLVITYSIRYVLIKVFVLISPFCFLSLCYKNTSILFKAWIKSFLSLLIVQIFVSIILLLIFSLNLTSNNISSKLILFAAISILIKANGYVKEMLGGISTEASININNLKSTLIK